MLKLLGEDIKMINLLDTFSCLIVNVLRIFLIVITITIYLILDYLCKYSCIICKTVVKRELPKNKSENNRLLRLV